MKGSKIPVQALCLLLVALLASMSCGNPRGKFPRGRQHKDQNQEGASEQQGGTESSEEEIVVSDGQDAGRENQDSGSFGDDSDRQNQDSGSLEQDSGSYSPTSHTLAGDGGSTKAALAKMSKGHPRLMLADSELMALDKRRKSDKVLAKLLRDSMNKANRYLKAPALKHTSNGQAMMGVAHEALKRSYYLGFAWRATRDKRYAKKMEEHLLQVCAFEDWLPRKQFLATAEFSHAVGLGYDWCYSAISSSARAKIRKGLIKNGLQPGIQSITHVPPAHWARTEYNWSIVCYSGLIIGALAIAEDEPKVTEQLIDFARIGLKKSLATFGPDGAWPEGPGYWAYAADYAVYGLAALNSALGTDFGLSRIKGLADTGAFALAVVSPSGTIASYSDVKEGLVRNSHPILFWLATFYGRPELASAELDFLATHKGEVQHIIWYPQASVMNAPLPTAPLDTFFAGHSEVMFMRGGEDPNDVYVPFKAGFNQINHAHLDLGNFEFGALGVNWARDLGSDSYGLPGYFEKKPGGRRWDYFRVGSFGHNVLTFGGKQQDLDATSKFIKRSSNPNDPFGIVEISGAYPKITGRIQRGIKLLEGRTAMLVQDEFELLKSTEIAWGMTTGASITLQGATARLKQNGKEMVATILEPAGAKFSKELPPKESKAYSTKGVSRLMIRTKGTPGSQRVVVQLSPVWPQGGATKAATVKPLSKW